MAYQPEQWRVGVSRFFKFLKPDKKEVLNFYVMALFSGLLSLVYPVGIQAVTNFVSSGTLPASWYFLVVMVLIALGAASILQILQLKILETMKQKIFVRISWNLGNALTKHGSSNYYSDIYLQEKSNRFFDIMSIQKGLPKIMVDFSSSAVQVIMAVLLLSVYHSLFLLFGIFLFVLIIIFSRYVFNPSYQRSLAQSAEKYAVGYWLEQMSGMKWLVSGIHGVHYAFNRLDKNVEQYLIQRNAMFKWMLTHLYTLTAFKLLIASVYIILGSVLVVNGEMNLGQFVAAEVLVLLIIGAFDKIFTSVESIYDVVTSAKKIDDVVTIGEVVEENTSATDSHHAQEIISYIHRKGASGCQIALPIDSDEKTELYKILSSNNKYNDALANFQAINFTVLGDVSQIFEGTLAENLGLSFDKCFESKNSDIIASLHLNEWISSSSTGKQQHVLPGGLNLPLKTRLNILIARTLIDPPQVLWVSDQFQMVEESLIDFVKSEWKKKGVLVLYDELPAKETACSEHWRLENNQFRVEPYKPSNNE